jgi:acyl-CoA reductase-like NAD-dependent aldehyde dehydrogenase
MAPSATNENGTNGHSASLDFTTFSNVINGKLVGTSKTRNGINPATKKPNFDVPVASPQDLDDAVAAAKAAFVKWSKTTIEERKEAVKQYAKALEEHTEQFAKLLTTEQGKPVSVFNGRF